MIFQERDPRYNVRRKYYPDGNGGWKLAEEMFFENKTFNPHKAEPITYEDIMQKHLPTDCTWIKATNTEKQLFFIILREMGYAQFAYVNPDDIREAQRKAKLFAPLYDKQFEKEREPDKRTADNERRSRRRAITKVYDYFNSNIDLNMFVTLTLSPDEVQRNDYEAIYKRLSTWLENRVKRDGLKYILIPEYHADGENIHFHGCMNKSALKVVNSGKRRQGKVVYNISDFTLGFTTAINISGEDSTIRVARYMLKYITKAYDSGNKVGGRYYLHGGKLALPRYEYANEPFPMDDKEHTFTPVGGVCCCIRKHI